jgi:aryl-alcohol dehydrogenase-like predicted oxidoreductase
MWLTRLIVDLIYAHRPDRQTPLEETVRAFNHLISTGKALYWGTSEWSAQEIATAQGIAGERKSTTRGWHCILTCDVTYRPSRTYRTNYGTTTLQHAVSPRSSIDQCPSLILRYSVREKVEKEFALLYDHPHGVGLGLTIFSPLKIGILTGKYNDGIPDDSRLATAKDGFIEGLNKTYGNEDWQKQFEIGRNLKPVAEKIGCSQAQLVRLALIRLLSNNNTLANRIFKGNDLGLGQPSHQQCYHGCVQD